MRKMGYRWREGELRDAGFYWGVLAGLVAAYITAAVVLAKLFPWGLS